MIGKVLHWVVNLPLLVLIAFLILERNGNRRPARVQGDGRIEFTPNRLFLWAWILFALRMAFIGIDFAKHGMDDPWGLAISAGIELGVLGILFSLPGTVVVVDEGLEQVYWFWRNKHIRWKEIVEIAAGEKSFTVTITGTEGTKIIHSRLMADRPRLLLELKQHCGENLPAEFPAEPTTG